MNAIIPLERMTVADKLMAMEQIWNDLCQNPDSVPSPAWHEDVLRARDERIRQGKAAFTDWEEAKVQLRASVR